MHLFTLPTAAILVHTLLSLSLLFTLVIELQTNTYQAVIISNGEETFTVFIYNSNELNWTGREGAYAAVGFSVDGNIDDFQNFENHGLSRRREIRDISQTNVRFNRPWTNVIYRIGVAVSEEQRARSRCISRVNEDRVTFSDGLNSVFQAILQPCPCSLFQAFRDRRFGFFRGISFLGNNLCSFARFFRFAGNGYFAGQRCCYDIRFVI